MFGPRIHSVILATWAAIGLHLSCLAALPFHLAAHRRVLLYFSFRVLLFFSGYCCVFFFQGITVFFQGITVFFRVLLCFFSGY